MFIKLNALACEKVCQFHLSLRNCNLLKLGVLVPVWFSVFGEKNTFAISKWDFFIFIFILFLFFFSFLGIW